MPKFLTYHSEPDRRWSDLEVKYRVLARETTAVWVRTYMEGDCTRRVCEWDAPSPESLHSLFARVGIECRHIVEVTEIHPRRWR
ncbi:MAG: DUF4242 domain-containing protein [bacterium]|nr:MAG: DUF4242 domain-containing protein [bacterium]